MLFLIFAVVFLILLIKALFDAIHGGIIMIGAICLLIAGYSLKFLASILRIFEAIQDICKDKKVCYA